MEVVVGSRTSVTKSLKKFVINEELNASCNNYSAAVPDEATLAEVAGMSVNQQIDVRGKVISVDAPEKLHAKTRDEILCRQDFTIADCSGSCRGVAWEKDVGRLKEDVTYQLKNVTVCLFNGRIYISLSPRSIIEEVSDIGEVLEENIEDGLDGDGKEVWGEVVGVISCESCDSSWVCKAKVVEVSGVMGGM